ncbi:MAG TPA: tetratricopeptide repeat protein, partial [Bacteroidales bacterium]|nr:tetratricopeptide repeat protein [Bacteroidales bacterium]
MKLFSIPAIVIFLVFSTLVSYGAQPGRDKKPKHGQNKTVPAQQNVSLLIDAKRADNMGDREKSEMLFRQYTEKYPDDAVGYFELAQILAAKKETAEAAKMIHHAVKLDPENIWYKLFEAEISQVTGDYKEAVSTYEDLVINHPDNLDYYYQLAALYLMVERYNDAVKVYDQIEEKIGVTEEISIQKEKIFLQVKDIPKAQAELEKLVTAFPDNTRYLSILAEFYLGTSKTEKALEIYQRISGINPGDPYINMSMADFYRKQGNKEKAYEYLKKGFENPNLGIDTKMNVLMSFYSVNDLYKNEKDQAFELARILVNVHPDDPRSHSVYGDLLSQDKQYTKAKEEFIKVISLDSSKYVIWEEILRLDIQTEDYSHLLDYSRRTIGLFPEQPVPYLFEGLAGFQLKKYDDALKAFR